MTGANETGPVPLMLDPAPMEPVPSHTQHAYIHTFVYTFVYTTCTHAHVHTLESLLWWGGQIFKKKERKERTSEVTVRPEIIIFQCTVVEVIILVK